MPFLILHSLQNAFLHFAGASFKSSVKFPSENCPTAILKDGFQIITPNAIKEIGDRCDLIETSASSLCSRLIVAIIRKAIVVRIAQCFLSRSLRWVLPTL